MRWASNSTGTGATPVSPALAGVFPAPRYVDQFFQDSKPVSAGLRPASSDLLNFSDGTHLPTRSAENHRLAFSAGTHLPTPSAKNHLPTTSAENLAS